MDQIYYAGQPLINVEKAGDVSDGYHTFNELYDHRCALFLAFQAMVHNYTEPFSIAWKSRKHADGSEWAGWFIAGLTLPAGQISYHVPDRFWDKCKGAERECAPEWDGHTSADVLQRLLLWLESPSTAAQRWADVVG